MEEIIREMIDKLDEIFNILTVSINTEQTQSPQKTLEERIGWLETQLMLLNTKLLMLENFEPKPYEQTPWKTYPWYPTYPYNDMFYTSTVVNTETW